MSKRMSAGLYNYYILQTANTLVGRFSLFENFYRVLRDEFFGMTTGS